MSDQSYQIRWLIRNDMPAVLEIENASFPNPWAEADFLDALRQRNCIGMVAQDGKGRILAFMVYELHQGMMQLLNFAVHPDYRKQGVGDSMVQRLKHKLAYSHKRNEIFAPVRETNLDAQLFFKACGFRVDVTVKDYYENTGDEAYIFRYQLERADSDFAPGFAPTNRISKILEGGGQ